MGRRKIGFRLSGFKRWNIVEALTALARIGYDGVELCLEHPDLNPDSPDFWDSRKLKPLLHDLGLEVSAVSFHGQRAPWEEKKRKCARGLEMAAELETSCFISGSCLGKSEQDLTQMRRFSEEMCRIAEGSGVFFAVEPEPDTLIHGSREMRKLMKDVASEPLRLNLDVGHAFLTEGDVVNDILQWGNKIVHTHIEDIKNGKHAHLIPGEGNIDFNRIIVAFDQIGYVGFLVLDLFDIMDDPLYYGKRGLKGLRRKVAAK